LICRKEQLCRLGADLFHFEELGEAAIFSNPLRALVEPDGIEPTTSSMPLIIMGFPGYPTLSLHVSQGDVLYDL